MEFNYLIVRSYILRWFKQFARFVLVGLSGAAVDFGIYLLLTRGFFYWQQHFILASTISSLAAATNNFCGIGAGLLMIKIRRLLNNMLFIWP